MFEAVRFMEQKTKSKRLANRPRVVIIGGGFSGIECARNLRRSHAEVIVIDRNNHMAFQPLLYQVATGVLSENAIASPLRRIFEKQNNVTVLMADIKKIDVDEKSLRFSDSLIYWDYLVVAAGMENNYFGNSHWEKYCPGLKTVAEASNIRARILSAFENAERSFALGKDKDVDGWLTFVIVGGGATGVELAGAIKQLAVNRLSQEFNNINMTKTRVLLVDCKSRILSSMSVKSSTSAQHALERYGVEVLTNTAVTDVTSTYIKLNETSIPTRTVIWAAGVAGSPLAAQLADPLGIQLSRSGKIPVNPDLTVANRSDIRVIGDLVQLEDPQTKKEIPGVAQAALQMGRYAGRSINFSIQNKTLKKRIGPFKYHDKGAIATVGRGYAVLDASGIQLSGSIAWLIWAIAHIYFLINFRSRLAALWSWMLAYIFNSGINELIIANNVYSKDTLDLAIHDEKKQSSI